MLPNHTYMLQPAVYHNSDETGIIITRVPLAHHQTNVTLAWTELGTRTGYYIFIMLYVFYEVLLYLFPTSISPVVRFSCGFQLSVCVRFNINTDT